MRGPPQPRYRPVAAGRNPQDAGPAARIAPLTSRRRHFAERDGLDIGDQPERLDPQRSGSGRTGPAGSRNFPTDASRPSSTPWPPPMPRPADFPRPCKRPARPQNWPLSRTTARWPNPSRPRFRCTKRELPSARCRLPFHVPPSRSGRLKKGTGSDCWGGSCTATPGIAVITGVAVQLPPQPTTFSTGWLAARQHWP